METMKLSLIQMNSNSWVIKENIEKAVSYINKAAEKGAELVVLPEFFNTPYFYFQKDYKFLKYAEREDGPTISAMRDSAKACKVHLIATILEEEGPGIYFDTAIVINPAGDIIGKYRKTHPAALNSLEKIYFKAGSRYSIFHINGWKVGVMICYDTDFPEVARGLALRGAELIIAPFATPGPRPHMWAPIAATRATDNGVYVAQCNKVGEEEGHNFMGRSLISDPVGHILVEGESDKEDIVSYVLDRSEVYEARKSFPFMRDRRPGFYKILSQTDEEIRNLI